MLHKYHVIYSIQYYLPYFALYSRFPAEFVSILFLAFLLFASVAAISQCLCSESPYLSIKLYCIYVRYTNITLYIAFSIICGPLPPYSCFPAEFASILFLVFSPFASVAAISQCLCSESPYLSIKLYCIYVCYTNIMLYIPFSIICSFT
jgi:hypothetical protein